jgi:hypothetical protein
LLRGGVCQSGALRLCLPLAQRLIMCVRVKAAAAAGLLRFWME